MMPDLDPKARLQPHRSQSASDPVPAPGCVVGFVLILREPCGACARGRSLSPEGESLSVSLVPRITRASS